MQDKYFETFLKFYSPLTKSDIQIIQSLKRRYVACHMSTGLLF